MSAATAVVERADAIFDAARTFFKEINRYDDVMVKFFPEKKQVSRKSLDHHVPG